MIEYKLENPNKPTDSKKFYEDTGFNLFVKDDGYFYVTGCSSQEEAKFALDSHNPSPPVEPTIIEKLASVGLDFEELKAAILGGGN